MRRMTLRRSQTSFSDDALGGSVSVLSTTVIAGLDADTYDHIIAKLGPALRTAPGFRSHLAYADTPGWTVVEVWDSEAELSLLRCERQTESCAGYDAHHHRGPQHPGVVSAP